MSVPNIESLFFIGCKFPESVEIDITVVLVLVVETNILSLRSSMAFATL